MAAEMFARLCGRPPCEQDATALNPAPRSQVSCNAVASALHAVSRVPLPPSAVHSRMKGEEETPAAQAEETWLKLKGLQSGSKELCLLQDLKFPVIYLKCSILTLYLNQML